MDFKNLNFIIYKLDVKNILFI